MSKPEYWASLADIEAKIRKDAENTIKYIQQDVERQIKRHNCLRLALQLVPELSSECKRYTKYSQSATLHLGHFKSNQKHILGAKLRELRRKFGCALVSEGWDLSEKRDDWVLVTLRPRDFKAVTVTWTERLPEGSKCKVVTEQTKRLQCNS